MVRLYCEEIFMKKLKWSALLSLVLLVACGKIDRSMEAELKVRTPLTLKAGDSGTLRTVAEGTHSIILQLQSGESSKGPGLIVLNVGGEGFPFEVPAKGLSELVNKNSFMLKLASEDLGQPYDIKLTHRRKITDGKVQFGYESDCSGPWFLSEPRHRPPYRRPPVWYHDRIIDEYYQMVLLEPGSSGESTAAASIKISEQRVERVEHSYDCFY